MFQSQSTTPIQLAKQVASLDFVSNGRFEFGVGFGWNPSEMRNHGIDPDPKSRRALLREKVLFAKALWTQEVASFEGALVQLAPSVAWPKPVQRPHPPVHLGGAAGPTTFAHVVEYCDAWMPSHNRGDILSSLDRLRASAEDAGRDPGTIALEVFSAPCDAGVLAEYAAHGFRRAVLRLERTEAGAVEQHLDEYAKLVPMFSDD